MLRRSAAFLLAAVLSPLLAQTAPHSAKVILMIGPPGSGKTTQSRNVHRKYGIPSITMSDLLKKEGGWRKTKMDKGLKAEVESGELVNDQQANDLIAKRTLQKDAVRGFILDGYPATQKQAEYLEAMLKERGYPAPVVINLNVPDEVVTQRMLARRQADDKPEIIERRLREYHQEFDGILKRYEGPRLKTVDGSKSPQEVWREIQRALAE